MYEATGSKQRLLKDGTIVELVPAAEVKPKQRRYRLWAETEVTALKWGGPTSGVDLHTDPVESATFCWVEVLPALPTLPGPEGGLVSAEDVAAMAAKQAPVITKAPPLPTDDKSRKGFPVFTGPLMYFPHALLQVAAVCKAGNDQHNPGQPMHWARDKSTDQLNTALRHMMDHGLGNTKDIDGTYHLAKAVWRLLAELQLTVEKDLKCSAS